MMFLIIFLEDEEDPTQNLVASCWRRMTLNGTQVVFPIRTKALVSLAPQTHKLVEGKLVPVACNFMQPSLYALVTRGSDQLESLSSFGHCAHFTIDYLCNFFVSIFLLLLTFVIYIITLL